MRFDYLEFGNNLRPVIPVTLSWKGKSIQYEMLADSGSDHTFLDWEIGTRLGLDLQTNELEEIYGIGGKLSLYYPHPVTITVGEVSYTSVVGFIPQIGGGILPPNGIAGQKGFFDKFVVKFDLANKEIEVKPNK